MLMLPLDRWPHGVEFFPIPSLPSACALLPYPSGTAEQYMSGVAEPADAAV